MYFWLSTKRLYAFFGVRHLRGRCFYLCFPYSILLLTKASIETTSPIVPRLGDDMNPPFVRFESFEIFAHGERPMRCLTLVPCFYRLSFLHTLSKLSPSEAVLFDGLPGEVPLDVAFADEKSAEFPRRVSHRDLDVLGCDDSSVQLQFHFVRHVLPPCNQ